MRPVILLSLIALSSCTTTIRETQPSVTAMQQYLVAQSTVNAAKQFTVANPKSLGLCYVDSSNFDGSKFAISEIERVLLKNGVTLTTTETKADTIIEIRSGVQSIDNRVIAVGIPSIPLPTPFPSFPLQTPNIPFVNKDQSIGVTMIGITAMDAKTGLMVDDLGEKLGISYNSIWTSIVSGTWERNDFQIPARP